MQLTPPGSPFPVHLEKAAGVEQPHTDYLVVTDLEGAQRELKERGLDLRNVRLGASAQSRPVDHMLLLTAPSVVTGFLLGVVEKVGKELAQG